MNGMEIEHYCKSCEIFFKIEIELEYFDEREIDNIDIKYCPHCKSDKLITMSLTTGNKISG